MAESDFLTLQTTTVPREGPPLKLVIVQPTPFCNLDCTYCYLPNRAATKVMAPDTVDRMFARLFASPVVGRRVTVVWHAGEPLVPGIAFYEHAFAVERRYNAGRVEVRHTIQTNGTLLDEAWADFLKANQVRVGLSLDGPRQLHDARRRTRSGLGTFDKVMRALRLIQERGVDYYVLSVLTPEHLSCADELYDFYVAAGVRSVGFNVEEAEGVNVHSSLERATDVIGQFRAFVRRFYRRVQDANGRASPLQVREFIGLRGLVRTPGLFIRRGEQCTPLTMLNIDCDGNFSTFSPELLGMKSAEYGDFLFGNVHRDRFEALVESEKFRRVNADIEAGVEMCRHTCPYFAICGGGAPANKYFENGTFRSTETLYCRLRKKELADVLLEEFEMEVGPASEAVDTAGATASASVP
jgi:uncharacterized protein